MNKWTELSVEYANQRSYLDDLFQVYPTIPEGIRDINKNVWEEVEKSFKEKNNDLLIRQLLKFELFPIKDSYISYLKRDSSAIERNPRTINRICGRLYEMGHMVENQLKDCFILLFGVIVLLLHRFS